MKLCVCGVCVCVCIAQLSVTERSDKDSVQLHENKIIYQTQPFYYAVTLTWATCFDSLLSHLQALFFKNTVPYFQL